jgi:asparagine synthase (glutamine-hydrolysing)
MCGIVGMVDIESRREPNRELLRRMNAVQHHRGPDEHSEYFEPGVAFGHRRLSIIDLASGQQPMFNEDGSIAIVYNGEIYNYEGIARELVAAGHKFRTHCDTEVIVHAWEEWGEDCVKRFNGMFAFALWDRNQRTLFLGRDRLGKKPLYYTLLPDGHVAFASELKSIAAIASLPRDFDDQAIEDYFAFGYIPDPKTIYRSVRKLPPAHTLRIRTGSPIPLPREYWDVRFEPRDDRSEAALSEELIARLRESTQIRLMSEVPLGAFLSGGVDSSAIVAMMAGKNNPVVNTCSIAFKDPSYDESRYAALVAAQYHTNHHVDLVDTDDFDLLDTLAGCYDEPFADSSSIPTYRVCELARRHVTVALSGDGGDEVFAGYRRYRWHMNEELVRRALPDGLRRRLFRGLGALYPKMDWAPRILRAKATLQGIARDSVEGYFHSVTLATDAERQALFAQSFRERLGGYNAIEVFRGHAGRRHHADALSLVQYLDFKTYLPGDILTKVDRASMAHSLEVRCPLLDYTLIEWAAGVPSKYKLRGGEGKLLFKHALEPHLPREILYRNKMGFAVPIGSWLRGPLRERTRTALLEGALPKTGIFAPATLEMMVADHQAGRRDFTAPLWSLLMFEAFLRKTSQL